jgi:nitrous oxidase accessory protein NosD
MGEPRVDTLFPLFSGENVSGIAFEDLTLDGNRTNNGNLNGNFAGCIWLQDCSRVTIRKVTAQSYNGDGISWQICHDVVVEDCHSHDHTGKGLHPGSGSQRSVIRRNRLTGNDEGLYFCWGVRWGLAEQNYIEGNRSFGLSIGHRDTNNLVRDNDIRASGKVGVLFRKEPTAAFQGNRNQIEGNRISGVMDDNGIGIDVQGQTESIGIENNQILETLAPSSRIGIRIGPEVGQVKLNANRIDGFSRSVVDLRGGGKHS